MNANNTTSQGRARRREKMLGQAREIRREFAKIHEHMGKILASAHSKKALNKEVAASCTCPSGDGSLIWPCPEHPEAAPVDIAHLAGMAKELASNAHSHSKEACRLRQSTAHKLAHELRQVSKENK